MSIVKSYDRGVQKQCRLDLRTFESTGLTVKSIAKPHQTFTLGVGIDHIPTWQQLSSGVWALLYNRANGDLISLPAAQATDLNFTSSDFSGFVWCKFEANQNGFFMGNLESSGLTSGWGWYFIGTAVRLCTSNAASGFGMYDLAWTYESTRWHSFAFSKSGTAAAGYIDGRPAPGSGSVRNPVVTSPYDFSIGRYGHTWATLGLDASLCLHRVWNRVLSPVEHMEIFNRERHLFGV